jgi:L-threonylcarbamoyladenylate synthase
VSLPYQTLHWRLFAIVDKGVDNLEKHPAVREAAAFIRAEELVAFPTETVYGLGADALSDKASRKIFTAKGRPSDNPLIVHVACVQDVENIVDNIPDSARTLMETFWPGPLTLVLKSNKQVCRTVTAGLQTVAVRLPDHPLARAFITASGRPLAAPSANRSGKPSPTNAHHVLDDLQGRIAGVLDGGPTGVGVESTVVDCSVVEPIVLRPGGVTKQELEACLGYPVQIDPALEQNTVEQNTVAQNVGKGHQPSPKSPGVKYTHYAPEGEMWLMSPTCGLQSMRLYMTQKAAADVRSGWKVGLLTTDDGLEELAAQCREQGLTFEIGQVQDAQTDRIPSVSSVSSSQQRPQSTKTGHADAHARTATPNPAVVVLLSLGQRQQPHLLARRLYAALRRFDEWGVDRIYAESVNKSGIGEALMNRLLKAAGGKILYMP